MVSCYPATFENGSNTRMYIDTTPASTATWVLIGGETSSKISVKSKTADAGNKDVATGADMSMPVGYSWTMSCDAAFDLDDPGQMEVRKFGISGMLTRRIAWRPYGSSVGFYGWAVPSWDGDATRNAVTRFTCTFDGCGDMFYTA